MHARAAFLRLFLPQVIMLPVLVAFILRKWSHYGNHFWNADLDYLDNDDGLSDCVAGVGGFHDVNALQVDPMEDMYFNGTGYIYLDNFNT